MTGIGISILKGPVAAAILAADATAKTGSPAWLVAKVAVREVTRDEPPSSEETVGNMERGFLLGAMWAGGRLEREWRRNMTHWVAFLDNLRISLDNGGLDEEAANQLVEVVREISKLTTAKKADWVWKTGAKGENHA